MSKDHFLHLYTKPDLDKPVLVISHHRTNIKTTGTVIEDLYPFPINRKREKFEEVITTQRGSREKPKTLYRRIL